MDRFTLGGPPSSGPGRPNAGVPGGLNNSATGLTTSAGSGYGSGTRDGGTSGQSGGGRGGLGTHPGSGSGSAPNWFSIPSENLGGFNIDPSQLAGIGQGFDGPGLRQTAAAFEIGVTVYVGGWGVVAAAPGIWAGGTAATPYVIAGWNALYGTVETVTFTGIGAAYIGAQTIAANPQWIVGTQRAVQGFTPGAGGWTAADSIGYWTFGYSARQIANWYEKHH